MEPLVARDSYLELLVRHFKVFGLQAVLYDAAGAVRTYSGKGSGDSYTIGRGPISRLLGHLTGLLFCLHVKLFLSSIFNSLDFWSSIFGTGLDIEFAEMLLGCWEFFLITKFRDTHFLVQRSTNPQSKRLGVQETCPDLCGTVEQWTFGLQWASKPSC